MNNYVLSLIRNRRYNLVLKLLIGAFIVYTLFYIILIEVYHNPFYFAGSAFLQFLIKIMGLSRGYFYIDSYYNIISTLATFLSAILGIAIPISLSVINALDQKYEQEGIILEFCQEPIYKLQFVFLGVNIPIIIISLLCDLGLGVFYFVYISFFMISILSFLSYVFLIQGYFTDIDSILLNKMDRKIDEVLPE